MRDTAKLISDLRYWQERSKSKGELFKAAADEIESRQWISVEGRLPDMCASENGGDGMNAKHGSACAVGYPNCICNKCANDGYGTETILPCCSRHGITCNTKQECPDFKPEGEATS